jgi:hypothetical protein
VGLFGCNSDSPRSISLFGQAGRFG